MSTKSVAFDRAVEYYDQTRGFPPGEEQNIAALIARVGGFQPASRVIEIGIGTGRIALPLSSHTSAYWGADISRPMLMKLKSKQTIEPVHVAESDATQLPYPDRTFDGAIAVHIFHLIPNWQAALAEVARVLRPTAPLVHGWTEDSNELKTIWDAWNEVVPTENRAVGMSWQINPHFLEDEGWRPLGEKQGHSYTVQRSIRHFLEMVKGRRWSALWRLTDEELARGLAVIEPLIEANYPDRDAPVEGRSTFYACAYLPPE